MQEEQIIYIVKLVNKYPLKLLTPSHVGISSAFIAFDNANDISQYAFSKIFPLLCKSRTDFLHYKNHAPHLLSAYKEPLPT